MAVEYHSSLIRIWREADPAQDQVWHGQVEQIQSGDCWAIQSVEALLALINVAGHEINLIKSQKIENGTNAMPDPSNKPPIKNSKHETA